MKNYYKKFSFIIFITIIFTFNDYCLALKCTKCDKTNKDCTINPQNVKESDCTEKDKFCYVKLVDNGEVERGCTEDEKYCGSASKEECDQCKDDNCNAKIFPDKRPKCYVCSGIDCFKVDAKNIQYCQYYKKDQKEHCFTKTVDNKNVIRNCLENYAEKCEENNCKKCPNPDDKEPCNKEEITPTKFSCYTCRSDADEECIYAARDKAKLEECKDEKKGCYSEYWDGKTFRACAEILDENETKACKDNKKYCFICDKDKCNGEKLNSGPINSISVILLITSILFSGKFFN